MYLIEFMLLRPEVVGDHCLPICPDPNCTDCDGEDPYSYRLQIILPADNGRFSKHGIQALCGRGGSRGKLQPISCRRFAGSTRPDMQKLEKAYKDWIYVRAGADTTQRSEKLNALIDLLFQVKNVYPSQKLQDCGPGMGSQKFILGNTALGTMQPKTGGT